MGKTKIYTRERQYLQCDCRNKHHTKISKEKWSGLIQDQTILEDTSTMIVTINSDGTKAECICAWCEYKESVDLTKTTLTLIQHGKVTILGQVV
ncbi:MAG: hypothetical protein DRI24_08365 [Deltaproteobacteria bacterium]|nr:MAG: hypothetical protein DRI24_08365 [Deltaproteobacteria bacterium]